MATSEAKVCNIALRQLRAQRIADLSDASREGQLCQELFADARDWVMACHPWNFAMTRQTLAVQATAPDFGFSRQFAMPTSPFCLRAWKLNGTVDSWVHDGDRFKVEGRALLTDATEGKLLYIARVADVSLWSPGFVQALAAYLKWQMAYGLTGQRTVEADAEAAFNTTLRRARSIDQNEGDADDAPVSPFVAVRA